MIDFNKDIQFRLEKHLNYLVNRALSSYAKNALTPQEVKDRLSKTTATVKFLESSHDSGDPQDFISNNSTCWNRLKYELKLVNPITTEKYIGELMLPYMLQGGMFILDGKPRIATNNLNTDYDCSYVPDEKKFQLNGVQYFIMPDGILVKYRDSEGNNRQDIVLDQSELDRLGVNTEVDVDQKLKLIYLIDLKHEDRGNIPDKLDYKFIKSLPTWKGIETKKDSVANLRIDGITKSLIDYIHAPHKGERFSSIENKILSALKTGLFPQKNISPTFAVGSLMTYIMQFFRKASDSGIDIATVVNPLVFDQLHSKLTMPHYLPYTQAMSDIIDPANTP